MFSITLAVLLGISMLAGCRKDSAMPDITPTVTPDNTPKAKPPSEKPAADPVDATLTGKYILSFWDDEDGNYVDHLISIGISPESIYIELRSDGTYTWDRKALDTGIDKGTYRAVNNTLMLSYDGGKDELVIDGNRLSFYTGDGDLVIFEKAGAKKAAKPSTTPVLSERWALSYWRESGGGSFTYVYSDQLRDQGIDTDDIYFEFRNDGTFILDLSTSPDYKGIVLGGSYSVDKTEGKIMFDWDKAVDAKGFYYDAQTNLSSDGDWFGINLATLTNNSAQASFKKVLPTPPFSFRDSLPISARGMYALKAWITDEGDDILDDLLLDDIRSDLLYIDFMNNGRFLLSLHAAFPGFFSYGTYWTDGDSIILEWEEEWDADYFPVGASLRGSTVTLVNSEGDMLEFDKEFGGGYPPSTISYRDSYLGSPLGSAKTLDGTVLVVGIFIVNEYSVWNDELISEFRDLLRWSLQYLEEVAYDYDTELHFYQYQTVLGNDDLFYMMDLDGLLAGGDDSDELVRDTRIKIDNFIEENIPYLELADKYRTNNITYVVFTTENDRSYAWPYYADFTPSQKAGRYHEKSIVFINSNFVLVHEILHTYGAVDFYREEGKEENREFFGVNGELMDHIAKNYPQEVMRRSNVSNPQLSPFTAYRLGWLDDLPELTQFPNFKLPGDIPGIMASYRYKPKV